MSRYIDADELLKCKMQAYDEYGVGLYVVGTGDILRMPSADVVEVVRCEDCKHGHYYIVAHTDNYGTSVKAKVYCRIWQDWVSANGYCFLADKRERREDERK